MNPVLLADREKNKLLKRIDARADAETRKATELRADEDKYVYALLFEHPVRFWLDCGNVVAAALTPTRDQQFAINYLHKGGAK